jgi:hypothetical protein
MVGAAVAINNGETRVMIDGAECSYHVTLKGGRLVVEKLLIEGDKLTMKTLYRERA